MKPLKTYLEELFATPMNTCGMGDISASTNISVGSGDIPQVIQLKLKKKKRKHKNGAS